MMIPIEQLRWELAELASDLFTSCKGDDADALWNEVSAVFKLHPEATVESWDKLRKALKGGL